MRHQRLGIFPLFNEHELGGIGHALMEIVSDVSSFLAGLGDAGFRRSDHVRTRFRLDGQSRNNVDQGILPDFAISGRGP